MNQLAIIKEGQSVIDSREVAKMIDKEHFNLMRDIKGYIEILGASSKLKTPPTKLNSQDFFIESVFTHPQNKQQYPCYLLTKKGCELVANKMIGEKGVLFTAAYVTRFEEMEKQLLQQKFNLPTNYVEALRVLATSEEERQILKPKAEKFDRFLSTENVHSMLVAAKTLGVGRATLFSLLRAKRIFIRNGRVPYQQYIDKGFFKVKYSVFIGNNGDVVRNRATTYVTPKGIEWLATKIKPK